MHDKLYNNERTVLCENISLIGQRSFTLIFSTTTIRLFLVASVSKKFAVSG